MYRDESRRDVESDQTDAMMALGRWVRRRRESLGITQEELAAAIDASQRYISRILGHSSPAVTLTFYSHVIEAMEDEAAGTIAGMYAERA